MFGLFRKKPVQSAMAAFDATKLDVESIIKLDLSTDAARAEHGELVLRTLKRLDAEIHTVQQRANGYPSNPISADVWLSGAGYGNLASELTRHFKNAGWLQREEIASSLWAKATLAVCSHYHHMVGPAMLASADCQDRLGNTERSWPMYAAVVRDFAFLLDDWDNEIEGPMEDDRLAIESLLTATERLLARGTTQLDDINLVQIQLRTKQLLLRPSDVPCDQERDTRPDVVLATDPYATLEQICAAIRRGGAVANVRGTGAAKFVFAERPVKVGRAIEISQSAENYWVEFWEASEDPDVAPVSEHSFRSASEALEAISKWLGP
jgi:hypothetical protein